MVAIAIDGPSGAGKSSLSKELAKQLGYIYVDTGAIYRSFALAGLRAGIDLQDAEAVAKMLPGVQFSLRYIAGAQCVFLGEEDVSQAIREENVSMGASMVSAHPAVREFLLETQRRMAREKDVIMDGRDIGTVVLPHAQVKIFLTASVEDRARRRWEQLRQAGENPDFEKVRKDVEQRDYNDSHRAAAPLKQAEDAVLLDTSGLSFAQSLEKLEQIVQQKLTQ